jgi:cell division protease FtsH
MNATIKAVLFWACIAISAALLWQTVRTAPKPGHTPEISYSQFISEVEAGRIARVNISGNRIQGQYREGNGTFQLTGPNDAGPFLDKLQGKSVEVWFRDGGSMPLQLLGTWAPLILLGALWLFMIRQMQHRKAGTDDLTKTSSHTVLGR